MLVTEFRSKFNNSRNRSAGIVSRVNGPLIEFVAKSSSLKFVQCATIWILLGKSPNRFPVNFNVSRFFSGKNAFGEMSDIWLSLSSRYVRFCNFCKRDKWTGVSWCDCDRSAWKFLTKKSDAPIILIRLLDKSKRSNELSGDNAFHGTSDRALFGNPRFRAGVIYLLFYHITDKRQKSKTYPMSVTGSSCPGTPNDAPA